MKLFGPNERLFDVEDSTTSISADVADLGEEIQPGSEERVETEIEDEIPSVEDEIEETEDEIEEVEETETPPEPEPEQTFHPFDRPSIKQLNEAFPDLFKRFPSLKDMYFREAEFSKVFPTIEDAKEASENNLAFTNIRTDIFSGNGDKFISAIKDVNEKGLEKFASNFLPNLVKVSPNSFWRAANPLVEDIARSMFKKGIDEGNESLQNAARYLSKYFFNDTDIAEGKKTTVIKEEPSEVSKEREEFDKERHNVFSDSVNLDLRTQLLEIIIGKDSKTGKTRIDPDDVLSPFIRATIIDRVIQDVGQQLEADKTHTRYMDSLWNHAKKNGRTDADKSRIISAYLARAKALIPSFRSKYVSEALGKRAKRANQVKERMSAIRESGGAHGRGSNGTKNYNPRAIDYSKTSDADILNDDIKYKN